MLDNVFMEDVMVISMLERGGGGADREHRGRNEGSGEM